jgi:hypothetical protein
VPGERRGCVVRCRSRQCKSSLHSPRTRLSIQLRCGIVPFQLCKSCLHEVPISLLLTKASGLTSSSPILTLCGLTCKTTVMSTKKIRRITFFAKNQTEAFLIILDIRPQAKPAVPLPLTNACGKNCLEIITSIFPTLGKDTKARSSRLRQRQMFGRSAK